MSELLTDVHRLYLSDEDLGISRNRHAGQLRDLGRRLSYNLGVYGTVDQNGLTDLVNLAGL